LLAWSVLYKGDLIDNQSCARLLNIMTGSEENINRQDPLYKRFSELKHFQRLHLTNLTLPELVILINVKPSTACQRISSRGEQQQVHETEEKLSLLRNAYLRVCKVIRDNTSVPVLVADGEVTLEEVCNTVVEFTTENLKTGSLPG
jgi:thymidylate kinase